MPELAAMLLRRSVGALAGSRSHCATCQRTPLPGEGLHELDSGRVLCDLCFAELPDERRVAVRWERVHASDRHLAAVPKPV
jgi:hypothetical protein